VDKRERKARAMTPPVASSSISTQLSGDLHPAKPNKTSPKT